ncbi:hypothetical protein DRO58_00905 [Candidatus Bathyarchaeota archaeon]|nr:MAG: hypothetical protein DRO58_00905 [Candidatus Bathyarchaeota archaeon]
MSRTEHHVKFRRKRVKRKGGWRTITLAEFYSLPNSKNPDVVAACNSSELKIMVKEAGKLEIYEIEGDEIIVYNDELYEKLLIYAAVRQGLRRPEKVIDLRETVKELGIYETHFWASSFAEIYRQTSDRRLLLRPAKAFKIFYRLVKK